MQLIRQVITQSWKLSPWNNFLVLVSIVISSISTVIATYVLGGGVSSLLNSSNREDFITIGLQLSILYSLIWFLGTSSRYILFPTYGTIEQKLQSERMARSLTDSIDASPSARSHADNGEISFAIDSEASAYRDTLSSIYLSILPATISLTSGIFLVVIASTWLEGIILTAAIVTYCAVSYRLIQSHQNAQTKFFKESMRSFGVLGNSLSLWKEATVFSTQAFLESRYRKDRSTVERAGVYSYTMTRRLYVAQGIVLAITICVLIIAIILRTSNGDAQAIGSIISSTGIAIAAITPLQSVGFGVSTLAVSVSHASEASEKIRPTGIVSATSQNVDLWNEQILRLSDMAASAHQRHEQRPIWVLGPSGSGKTTVLEGFLNLNEYSLPLQQESREIRENSTYASQSASLLNANAIDNVVFGRSIAVCKADELLTAIGLHEFSSTGCKKNSDVAGEDGGASGGEKQRIALARALIAKPGSIVVLDEPTSSLDKNSRALVWGIIEDLAREKTVIVSTHDASAPIRQDDTVLQLTNANEAPLSKPKEPPSEA